MEFETSEYITNGYKIDNFMNRITLLRRGIYLDTGPLYLLIVGHHNRVKGNNLLRELNYSDLDYKYLLAFLNSIKLHDSSLLVTPQIFTEFIQHLWKVSYNECQFREILESSFKTKWFLKDTEMNLKSSHFFDENSLMDKKIEVTDEINKKMIALQIESNVNAIAILDKYGSSLKRFKKRLEDSIKQINDNGEPLEPMPVIRMDSDEKVFSKKINIVLEKNINIINLVYAPIKENFHNYLYLIKLAARNKTNNLWIHFSELTKKFFKKSSPGHLLPLFGIDSYALNNRPMGFGTFKRKPVNVKRFDSGTTGFLEMDEHRKLYGENPNCDCFVEIKKKLSDTLEVYDGADLLSSALTCHETIASYNELLKGREKIITNKYKDYLKDKKYIQEPLKKLLKIDLAQKNLV